MNQWKILWDAYHLNATLSRLLKDIVGHGNKVDKLLLLIGGIIFTFGIVLVFINIQVAVWAVLLGEVIVLYKTDKLRELLILNQFGADNTSQIPHDDKDHKVSRYLMFKKSLREKAIHKSHVESCFELVETQIDIVQSSGSGMKKFASFSSGILIGLLATFWRKLDTNELIYIGIILISFTAFVCFILFLKPSRIEKLKEMKYFMQLYCREYE
ncbi:hypothetical protein A6D98_02985 [Aliivibrio fischeri]|uniref:hypothetical protein n=1 Tax=Aliivibrio fischeri TaxID=668 RepID=UPI0002E0A3B6|nr:hypothetical protein [Aliivibrio fischeri]OCH02039.1 hypothetical protein A6E10_18315 [Aliivibrio fischeri]OCH22569.1 hypothetical protein A6E12_18845 [Aliivibrio fischeri]OCH56934.1 hypothetical protein A6D98_02985 [Aliivibrio fischeri]OEE15971.1 hypothetical protein A1Q3_16940 [Aliivibrio fischeri ZF-211]